MPARRTGGTLPGVGRAAANTTDTRPIAIVVTFTPPYLVWRIGRTDYRE
ncbi:hypothetical protein [uncultured Sphingomonas sp.]|nr:hypothetical protein [uncultured Sphingomonas sp.]